jgi:predicted ribonuclease YlaK
MDLRPADVKIYIVDTSVLVSAPEALHHLTDGNIVV